MDQKYTATPSVTSDRFEFCIFCIFAYSAYCPFFNPIEYVFGIVKKHLKRKSAGSKNNMEVLVNEEFTKMRDFPCIKLFKKCRYFMNGKIDPNVAYEQNPKDFGFKKNEARRCWCFIYLSL